MSFCRQNRIVSPDSKTSMALQQGKLSKYPVTWSLTQVPTSNSNGSSTPAQNGTPKSQKTLSVSHKVSRHGHTSNIIPRCEIYAVSWYKKYTKQNLFFPTRRRWISGPCCAGLTMKSGARRNRVSFTWRRLESRTPLPNVMCQTSHIRPWEWNAKQVSMEASNRQVVECFNSLWARVHFHKLCFRFSDKKSLFVA